MGQDYETSDLWQAAFMICRGANLRKMIRDRLKPGRIIFCLTGENLERLAENFYQAGEAPALSFKDVALDLKHSVFKFLRENNNEGGGDGSKKTRRAN